MELLLLILIVVGIVWQRKTSQRLAHLEDEMSALSAQLGATSMPAPVEAQPTVAPAVPANVVDAEERQIAPEAGEAAARETVSPVPQPAGPPPSASVANEMRPSRTKASVGPMKP